MADYEERKGSVEVPKNVGIRGFLAAIETILKLPRVQRIEIDARGKIEYKHFVRAGEEVVALDFEDTFDALMPYAIIRNGTVVELVAPDQNAAVAMGQLFSMVAADHLHPVAVVGGAKSSFWNWYERSTGLKLANEEAVYGLPFLTDHLVEDNVLILCAGFARNGTIADTQKSYKLVIQ